jgi:hypothetical protein
MNSSCLSKITNKDFTNQCPPYLILISSRVKPEWASLPPMSTTTTFGLLTCAPR